MDLPPELRNWIYSAVLVRPYPLLLRAESSAHTYRNRTSTQPSLTRVNRQIRKESLSIFYDYNTFIISLRVERYRPWMRALGEESASMIRYLQLESQTRPSISVSARGYLQLMRGRHLGWRDCVIVVDVQRQEVVRYGTAVRSLTRCPITNTGFPYDRMRSLLEQSGLECPNAKPSKAAIMELVKCFEEAVQAVDAHLSQ